MIESAPAVALGAVPVVNDLLTLFPNLLSYGEVKIINAAPNPAQVSIGPDTHWIDSWSADVYCLRGSRRVIVTPVILGNPQTTVPNPSLLISVAEVAGEIPGVYPTVIDRMPGQQQNSSSGTLVQNNDALSLQCGGATFITFAFTPLVLTSSGRLLFEGTSDGTNWIGMPWLPLAGSGAGGWQSGQVYGALSIAGLVAEVACAGLAQVRVRLSTSGAESVPVIARGSVGGTVTVEALPAGGILGADSVLSPDFAVALAGSGTLDLVSAVPNKTITVLTWNVQITSTGATEILLEDDNGVTVGHISTAATGSVSRSYGTTGRSVTVGHKLRLRNIINTPAGSIFGEAVCVQK